MPFSTLSAREVARETALAMKRVAAKKEMERRRVERQAAAAVAAPPTSSPVKSHVKQPTPTRPWTYCEALTLSPKKVVSAPASPSPDDIHAQIAADFKRAKAAAKAQRKAERKAEDSRASKKAAHRARRARRLADAGHIAPDVVEPDPEHEPDTKEYECKMESKARRRAARHAAEAKQAASPDAQLNPTAEPDTHTSDSRASKKAAHRARRARRLADAAEKSGEAAEQTAVGSSPQQLDTAEPDTKESDSRASKKAAHRARRARRLADAAEKSGEAAEQTAVGSSPKPQQLDTAEPDTKESDSRASKKAAHRARRARRLADAAEKRGEAADQIAADHSTPNKKARRDPECQPKTPEPPTKELDARASKKAARRARRARRLAEKRGEAADHCSPVKKARRDPDWQPETPVPPTKELGARTRTTPTKAARLAAKAQATARQEPTTPISPEEEQPRQELTPEMFDNGVPSWLMTSMGLSCSRLGESGGGRQGGTTGLSVSPSANVGAFDMEESSRRSSSPLALQGTCTPPRTSPSHVALNEACTPPRTAQSPVALNEACTPHSTPPSHVALQKACTPRRRSPSPVVPCTPPSPVALRQALANVAQQEHRGLGVKFLSPPVMSSMGSVATDRSSSVASDRSVSPPTRQLDEPQAGASVPPYKGSPMMAEQMERIYESIAQNPSGYRDWEEGDSDGRDDSRDESYVPSPQSKRHRRRHTEHVSSDSVSQSDSGPENPRLKRSRHRRHRGHVSSATVSSESESMSDLIPVIPEATMSDDTLASFSPMTSPVKRKPASLRALHDCPIEGCDARVVWVSRHLRSKLHGMNKSEVLLVMKGNKKDSVRPKLPCPFISEDGKTKCGSSTSRLDQHMLSKHGANPKDNDLRTIWYARAAALKVAASESSIGVDAPQQLRAKILDAYVQSLKSRSFGKHASKKTVQMHTLAIRLFLPVLSGEVIRQFPTALGEKDTGIVDQILAKKTLRAKSLKTYLACVKLFAAWLSSRQELLTPLGSSHADCQQAAVSVACVIKSLDADEHRERIHDMAVPAQSAPLKPSTVEAFMSSGTFSDAQNLAALAKTRTLTREELGQVRDTLYLAITLDQIKRAGDANCIKYCQAQAEVSKFVAAGKPKQFDCQLVVEGGKVDKSGVPTIVNISSRLFRLFYHYTVSVRPQFAMAETSSYLFVSFSNKTDEKLSCSAVTKMYRRPWARYGREIGTGMLPLLTATLNRSMNVTIHREAGASEADKVDLAKHMSHKVSTAEKYYDNSRDVHLRRSKKSTETQRKLRLTLAAKDAGKSETPSDDDSICSDASVLINLRAADKSPVQRDNSSPIESNLSKTLGALAALGEFLPAATGGTDSESDSSAPLSEEEVSAAKVLRTVDGVFSYMNSIDEDMLILRRVINDKSLADFFATVRVKALLREGKTPNLGILDIKKCLNTARAAGDHEAGDLLDAYMNSHKETLLRGRARKLSEEYYGKHKASLLAPPP